MPNGWETVEAKLGKSENAEIRVRVQSLSLLFGSEGASAALQKTLADSSGALSARRTALESLVTARNAELAPLLQRLLHDPELRGAALRSLAAFEDRGTPAAILEAYPLLSPVEKKDALNTLASRAAYAAPLLQAVEEGKLRARDLTAEIIRQLRNLKSPEVEQLLQKVWGVARESNPDKKKEMEKYRAVYWAGGSQPGDASRGRAVFVRACAQCHVLFDTGGNVGPDLTGSNRSDLDYILQNMVDPNAVIPNEYRSSTLETRDERVLTGIVKKEDNQGVTIATANETLVIPRDEIKSLQQSDISMMPEGLLDPLTEQEVRDLIYYLSRPGQVPLPPGPEAAGK
jgi:putative heme-binding domain-containing protein